MNAREFIIQGDRRVRQERRVDLLRLHARSRCLTAALDRLPHPILLVIAGDPIRVWHANTAARRDLTGDCLLRLDGELLSVPDDTGGRQLATVMRRISIRGPGHPQSVELALEAGSPLTTEVHIEALDVDGDAGLSATRVLMLEIHARISRDEALQQLCRDYGLTPKEAEAALSLYATGSSIELARQAGKSIHTVRSQLKSAMQKTNTRTQAGLVALVGSRLTP